MCAAALHAHVRNRLTLRNRVLGCGEKNSLSAGAPRAPPAAQPPQTLGFTLQAKTVEQSKTAAQPKAGAQSKTVASLTTVTS